MELLLVNFGPFRTFAACLVLVLAAVAPVAAQHLTLEGQTGGFITPTAYVVYTEKGHTFSHPAVGYHMINATDVIGRIQTFSITEGFANRAEVGYTRSYHTLGNATSAASGDLSALWDSSGMNIFHGKAVIFSDGQFGPAMPGVAVGGVVRTNDSFVTSAIDKIYLGGSGAARTNGDVYVAVSKTWAKKPVPFLANVGWKATNASIFGIGGQSTRFGGRFFGGLGIPLPIGHGLVAVPSAGFTQEPKTATNLNTLMNLARTKLVAVMPAAAPAYPVVSAHLPTTLDYAVRITQRERPHFSIDLGLGQVAGNIGSIYVANPYYPTVGGPIVLSPIDLKARKVFGMGLSYRY
jgi:hypothetical protein